ncbi:MAG: hypothetical protein NT025_09985 [bacterium]|nr:hypothetical protein [bacterium]
MKVILKDIDVDIELGNNGILLQVYDNNDDYLGKLRIGRATAEWCKGRTPIGNGKKIPLAELIAYLAKR